MVNASSTIICIFYQNNDTRSRAAAYKRVKPSPGMLRFHRMIRDKNLKMDWRYPYEGSETEGASRLLLDEADGHTEYLLHADAPLALFRPPLCRSEPGRQGGLHLSPEPLPALPQEGLGQRPGRGVRHFPAPGAGQGTAGVREAGHRRLPRPGGAAAHLGETLRLGRRQPDLPSEGGTCGRPGLPVRPLPLG